MTKARLLRTVDLYFSHAADAIVVCGGLPSTAPQSTGTALLEAEEMADFLLSFRSSHSGKQLAPPPGKICKTCSKCCAPGHWRSGRGSYLSIPHRTHKQNRRQAAR